MLSYVEQVKNILNLASRILLVQGHTENFAEKMSHYGSQKVTILHLYPAILEYFLLQKFPVYILE